MHACSHSRTQSTAERRHVNSAVVFHKVAVQQSNMMNYLCTSPESVRALDLHRDLGKTHIENTIECEIVDMQGEPMAIGVTC